MTNRFTVILADPPWEYDNPRNHKSSDGGTPYEQMSLEAIKALPIRELAATDCALFLWATHPKLPEAFDVLKAWGFHYITVAFNWIKLDPVAGSIRSGMGHWTNGNCEPVLLGKIGSPRRQDKDVKQVVPAPMLGHSRKPDRIHSDIVRLMGDVPRVELFARRRTPGWVCVGNEVTGHDINEDISALMEGRWTNEDEARVEKARQLSLFAA